MAQPQRFDRDEMQRLLAENVSVKEIAALFGVTTGAIHNARQHLDPVRAEKARKRSREWQRDHNRGPCKGGCGRLVWIPGKKRSGYCLRCSNQRRAVGVTAEQLQCTRCKEWKGDTEFPLRRKHSTVRRERATICRSCQTIVRQEYRQRHKEPCTRCGRPRLSDRELSAGGRNPSGLCRPCFVDVVLHAPRASPSADPHEVVVLAP